MGLFDDDSIIGFDYNFDGKVDRLDDMMFFHDMEEEERREALKDAGLDPDDYDF